MADSAVKVAGISGAVSIVVALIVAGTTVYQTTRATEAAAKQATDSAVKANTSATKAQVSLKVAQEAASAIPGAVATHYRGRNSQPNASTARFDFSERLSDPSEVVVTGNDWRLIIPRDGTYYIGASFTLPYGSEGRSNTTPYVSCGAQRLRPGTTSPEVLSGSIAFNPSCSFAGMYLLNKGDQIFVQVGKAGAFDGPISGDFFSVLIGPTRQP